MCSSRSMRHGSNRRAAMRNTSARSTAMAPSVRTRTSRPASIVSCAAVMATGARRRAVAPRSARDPPHHPSRQWRNARAVEPHPSLLLVPRGAPPRRAHDHWHGARPARHDAPPFSGAERAAWPDARGSGRRRLRAHASATNASPVAGTPPPVGSTRSHSARKRATRSSGWVETSNRRPPPWTRHARTATQTHR